MRTFLIVSSLLWLAMTAGAVIITPTIEYKLLVAGFSGLIIAGTALTAVLWYKQGQVYEDRGVSGPDDE